MRVRSVLLPFLALTLLPACGTPSAQKEADVAPDPTKADQVALAIPTRVEARWIKIVLGTQWRDRTELAAIEIDRTDPNVWIARGGAEVKIGKLTAKASDELKISFLENYESFVLHAKIVALLEQDKGFTHRQANLHMATIADSELHIFSR